MTALHVERIARKRYECGWDCGRPIEPGARYVRSSLPPRTDPNESDGWWTHALHGHSRNDCPDDDGCWLKVGAFSGDRYCGRHGRAVGWPCTHPVVSTEGKT